MPRGSRAGIAHAQRFRWPPWQDRFRAHVDASPGHGPRGDCHLWTGAVTGDAGNQYGTITIVGRARRAHHVAWEIANGRPFPANRIGLHSCDVGTCVNPAHIRPGTHRQNSAEALARGRSKPHAPRERARGTAHGNARFTNRQVRAIRSAHGGGATVAQLARRYGAGWATIDKIVKRQTWRHV